ncbi:hypothetical protein TWF192_003078 [Orbilia oligospora]|nr:hypothetical protein TWF192_003078 [Orbilia oligospora]
MHGKHGPMLTRLTSLRPRYTEFGILTIFSVPLIPAFRFVTHLRKSNSNKTSKTKSLRRKESMDTRTDHSQASFIEMEKQPTKEETSFHLVYDMGADCWVVYNQDENPIGYIASTFAGASSLCCCAPAGRSC